MNHIFRILCILPILAAVMTLSIGCSSGDKGEDEINAVESETDATNGNDTTDADITADPNQTGESSESDEASEDVLVQGPAPQTPLINSSTARTISIESLELADTLVFFFSTIPNALFAAESDDSICQADGTVTVTNTASARTYVFESCGLFPEQQGIILNGMLSFEGTFDNGFAGEQELSELSVVSGLRTVSGNGFSAVEIVPGSTNATGAQLLVNDGQSDVTLKRSAFSVDSVSSNEQIVSLELIVDMIRFGFTDATIDATALTGPSVSCPQNGTLTVSAGSNGQLSVFGNDGENLTYTISDASDTLACSEISSILNPVSAGILIPPTPPE